MGMLSDLMYQRQDGYEPYQRQRVAEQMLLAQNSIPSGMQKQYIENDPNLYGPRPSAPAAPSVQPGNGNYSTPRNPRATIQMPNGEYVTPEQFELLQKRLREREQRMRK